jgi:GNAT superfamily N-acetyltransferase
MPGSAKTILVRTAAAGDTTEILDCLAAAFEPYRSAYTPRAYLDTVLTTETISDRLIKMHVFIAACGERVVGTIACAISGDSEGHLRGMAVLPEWQGQGVAEKLLSSAEDNLVNRGCSRITLDTTDPLQRAMRFYERHGYRRSGKMIDFYGMPLHEYVKDV